MIAAGWLTTAASTLVYPGGHPPTWYFVGGAVVLASLVLAPVGAGAGIVDLRAQWRVASRLSGNVVAALGMNLFFLLVAVALWCWMWWAATRR